MALDISVERIEKLPTAQKVLIVVAVIVLIYVLYYVLWVSKQHTTIKDKEKKLSDLNREVAKGQSVLQDIEHFKQIQEKLNQQLREAEKKLPKEAEIPQLLEKISELARGNLLVFPTFHPDKSPKPAGGGVYQQIFIDINLTGGYHQIARFLDQVSKLERIVNVDRIGLEPAGGGNLKSNVKLITYMFGG